MPVTLQFVEDSHIWDPLIAYVSHGWPTHVDIVIPPEHFISFGLVGSPGDAPWDMNDYRLFGARPDGGVKLRPAGYDAFKKIARIALPASPEQEAKVYAFLQAQLGKPYDFANVFGFVTGAHKQHADHWFCSMLALGACEAGALFPCPVACDLVACDPWDLFLVCSAFAPVTRIKP